MTKPIGGALLEMISLDRSSKVPLYLQLDAQIRQAVISGALAEGDRLPATRQLARDLGLSRLTVQNTYEQLVAEGFLTAGIGSGTFVAEIAQETLPPATRRSLPGRRDDGSRLSSRGRRISGTKAATRIDRHQAFRPGIPAPDLFPARRWHKIWSKVLKQIDHTAFCYGPPGGYLPLRQAIAAHLSNARGVTCEAEHVIVTSGAQQAFAISALALLDPGDLAWGEYPGHTAGRDVLEALGAGVASIPIDNEGLDLEAGRSAHRDPKLIFVTPSHQHPLGVTMSLRRRLALLRYAESCAAWILEDDYDSEFRYAGRPLPALQALDSADCVIYTGSFSKVLYPSLRLGYLVVPEDLVEAFQAALVVLSQGTPYLPQVVLAEFMAEGLFATHIRKMRVAYAQRQAVLLDSLQHHGAGLLAAEPTAAGMHVMTWLPEGSDDFEVSRRLWAAGIETVPLSTYCPTPYHRQGLLLGFTAVPPDAIEHNVQKLCAVLAG